MVSFSELNGFLSVSTLSCSEAKAVLTYAFASEAIENISVLEVKLLAQKLLAQKLNVDLDFSM